MFQEDVSTLCLAEIVCNSALHLCGSLTWKNSKFFKQHMSLADVDTSGNVKAALNLDGTEDSSQMAVDGEAGTSTEVSLSFQYH